MSEIQISNFEQIQQCVPSGVKIPEVAKRTINEFTASEVEELKKRIKEINNPNDIVVNKVINLYLTERSKYIWETKAQTWELKKETQTEKISTYPDTPEGMKKFFEDIEKLKMEPSWEYITISMELDRHLYSKWKTIKMEWKFFKNLCVYDKNGKKDEKYSSIIEEFLPKEKFENLIIFEESRRTWKFETRAKEIADKYNISLGYSDESEKSQLKTQILNLNNIEDRERVILMNYIEGTYRSVEKAGIENAEHMEKEWNKNKDVLTSVWIDWDKNGKTYVEQPLKLVKDLAKNPLVLFAWVGLILWKLFWKDIGGTDWKFYMKLFAWILWLWIYQESWLWKHLADNWGDYWNTAVNGWSKAVDYVTDWKNWKDWWNSLVVWSKEATEWLTEKWIWIWKETMAWGNNFVCYSNYEFNNAWDKKQVIDTNFEALYEVCKKSDISDLKSHLIKLNWTSIEDKDLYKLQKEVKWLYNEGIKRHSNVFEGVIKWKTLAEVINIATDNKLPNDSKTEEKKNDSTETKPDSKDKKDSKKTEDKKPNSWWNEKKVDLEEGPKLETPKKESDKEEIERLKKMQNNI